MNLSIHELLQVQVFFSIFQYLTFGLSLILILPYFARKEREYKKKEFDDKVNKEVEKRISELEGYKDEK